VLSCAAINVVSLAIPALIVYLAFLRNIDRHSKRQSILIHFTASIAFTLSWYWILITFLGAFYDRNVSGFSVSPFFGRAAVWQIMQGLTLYGLFATAPYFRSAAQHQPQSPVSPPPEQSLAPPLFYRDGDEIRPLDSDRIMFLRGADDYVEVTTVTSTHLLRATMAQLSARLGGAFLRVHRSWVVNSRHIVRVEPAGNGRMLLQMDNGALITTSRAGARIFREYID
jgi:hypothetical protein